MKKQTFLFTLIVLALITFTGCADVENIEQCTNGYTYGFWGGLWHGIIAPISFFGSLLNDNIAMYAHNNVGGWYDLGFIIGVGGLSFGGSKAKS